MDYEDILAREFVHICDLIALSAADQPDKAALIDDEETITFAELDAKVSRVAAALQRDGVGFGDVVAICATSTARYGVAFFGILRAGGVVAPLTPSSTPESLGAMVADCGAKLLFLDKGVAAHMSGVVDSLATGRVALDNSDSGTPFSSWLAPEGAVPRRVEAPPSQGFNIIYSSGTTGVPKGIVQSHAMRWGHIRRGTYSTDAVTLCSTPLYSNTTLVSFLPSVALGAKTIVMPKFDAKRFLDLSQRHRVTHAILVPVQYRRLLEHPEFDSCDLSSYVMKFCTSAPFPAELKAEVLRRWPGGLTEFYGMTEGGGGCMLPAHEHPDKLHTVGRPAPGNDVRLIDDEGREVPPGGIGEVVGRSLHMMNGYHNLPDKTAEVIWTSPEGDDFIRNGDVGRFDPDGFLILMDRKKDMIISGGFNIYPSDLEQEIVRHADVLEAAVVGVASDRWGETPVAFVVVNAGAAIGTDALLGWVNSRLGKTQRLSDLLIVDELPRSHIGKVLKRELRDAYRSPSR